MSENDLPLHLDPTRPVPVEITPVPNGMTPEARVQYRDMLRARAIEGAANLVTIMALREQLSEAQFDGLTGLRRPERFMRDVQSLHERASYESQYVLLASLDANHLKRINDTRGHSVGDRYLKSIASALEGATRPTDITGRLGGDEFGLAMLREERPEAAFLDDFKFNLHLRIENEITRHIPDVDPPAVSIGLTVWRDEEKFEEVLVRADSLMYQDKRQSR